MRKPRTAFTDGTEKGGDIDMLRPTGHSWPDPPQRALRVSMDPAAGRSMALGFWRQVFIVAPVSKSFDPRAWREV